MRKSKKATETTTETTAAKPIPAASTGTGLCFSAKRKDLAAHVRRLASIADKKASLEVLGFIAMRATTNGVILAATDLDVYGIIEAESWVVEDRGGLALSAKDLGEVLRKLPDGVVTIRAREGGARISCNGVDVYLQGISDRDFPKLPLRGEVNSEEIATVDADTFGAMIGAVEHAICQDQTRFHLAGIAFEYDGTHARMIATDGHRLAKVERDMPRAGDFKTSAKGLILRTKACKAMRSLLSKSGTCDIGMDHGMFLCRRKVDGVTTTISSKCVDAAFPPYAQVIPQDNRRLVTVDRAVLSGALDRAKGLCSQTRGATLEFMGEGLFVVASNPGKGDVRECIGGEFVGKLCDGFAIGVNPTYLIDALRGIEDERVTLAFSHDDSPLKSYEKTDGGYVKACQLSPMLVRATTDAVTYAALAAPYLSVVMPMRV